jgi:hypothetical protein
MAEGAGAQTLGSVAVVSSTAGVCGVGFEVAYLSSTVIRTRVPSAEAGTPFRECSGGATVRVVSGSAALVGALVVGDSAREV